MNLFNRAHSFSRLSLSSSLFILEIDTDKGKVVPWEGLAVGFEKKKKISFVLLTRALACPPRHLFRAEPFLASGTR